MRIRQRFHTCSSSTAGAAPRRGEVRWAWLCSALMAVVQWHKMPIRISSSQSVGPCAGIADALGALRSFPSLPSLFLCFIPFTLVGLFANANCLSPPGHFINFTARARPESSPARTFDFHVRFVVVVVVAIPCTQLAGYAAHLISVYKLEFSLFFCLQSYWRWPR